jgi:hypothetical protein
MKCSYILYKNKIQLFINKHKDRILNVEKTYINIQGKEHIIRLYWDGMVKVKDKKIGKFNEGMVEQYL